MLKSLIDRPIAVTMSILVAAVLGFVSLHKLPVSLIPDVDIPYITVQVSDASLSAREMDQSVLTPLRGQLIQINGLEDIVCEARDGSGMVRLTFGYGADMDYLFIEANEKIDRCMSILPPDIERPKVFKASATDIPAFFINVTLSNQDGAYGGFPQLSRFAREVLCKRIEQLEEVAMVDMSGIVDEQVLVIPDDNRLSQLGMTSEEFESALISANIRLGSLTIRDGEYRYNVRFDSRIGSAQEIGAIWFRSAGRLLQVKDVADVSVSPVKKTGLVRSDGKPAVSLAVIKQSDARMSELKRHIGEQMKQFSEDYPLLHFELTRDQTQLLEYSIRNLLWNILFGVLLACVVIFLFMQDLRSAALVSLTMPVALILSVFIFHLAGLSLNIISLSGLLLGVGMMADNSIILIDNITERWKRDGALQEAVLEGTKEVMGPMLSSVLTTCAIFIPLVFVSGIAGALFYDEAMAITIILVTAYLVTILVIPVYYWWWFKGRGAYSPNPILRKYTPDAALQRWDDSRMVWWIEHRWLAWGLIGLSAIGLAICFASMRKERLPEMTVTDSILFVDWNDRISVEENERRTIALENVLGDDVLQTTALVGSQQFVLGHSGDQGIAECRLYFRCQDRETREKLEKRLSNYLTNIAPGANWKFEPADNIFTLVFADESATLTARLRPVGNPEIRVEELQTAIEQITEAVSGIPIPAIETKTDVLFMADDQKMVLYDVSYEMLVAALRNALNENRLFSIIQGSRTLPVVTGADRENLSAILMETFIEKEGMRIPVSVLMKQTYVEDLKSIVSGAEGNYYPVDFEVNSSDAEKAKFAVEKAMRENDYFEVSFSGSWFQNRKLANELLMVLLIAISLLYLILAIQFESLLQPVIILLEIVMDFFFALVVLWICGVTINLMSLIGFVVVTGIVINDSILKIDTINRLRRSGTELSEAVITASSRRMKAIIMTSLTTILAILPFLFRGSMGADLQYPLAVVIISGMMAGTLVSLFIVPTLYYSIYAKGQKS